MGCTLWLLGPQFPNQVANSLEGGVLTIALPGPYNMLLEEPKLTQTLGLTSGLFFFLYFLFIYLAVPGLSHSMQTLSCSMWDLVP